MENTDKVRFGDDPTPQWYVAISTKEWVGPLTSADVYHRIESGEFNWAHYLWRNGEKNWTRICDHPAFAAVVPDRPNNAIQTTVKQASREILLKAEAENSKVIKKAGARRNAVPPPPDAGGDGDLREWFLHYNESQFGPFSFQEVARFLRVGKINPKVYAWKDGMGTWLKIDQIGEFDDAVSMKPAGKIEGRGASARASSRLTDKGRLDQRETPRRPMVARILLSNNESVIVAVCRDISVGGMQVLTDRVPGAPGTRIKLNVSPSGEQEKKLSPFVADGVIVRVLEDGLGFSFRFEKLPEATLKALEDYIASGY